jgi:hypothetical protein
LSPAFEDNGVAIMQEGAGAAVFEGDGLRAFPGEFEHRAVAVGCGAADGAGGAHIPDLEVAAVGGVVSQLLRHIPVHVFEVGLADPAGGSVFGLNPDFQRNIKIVGLGAVEVG